MTNPEERMRGEFEEFVVRDSGTSGLSLIKLRNSHGYLSDSLEVRWRAFRAARENTMPLDEVDRRCRAAADFALENFDCMPAGVCPVDAAVEAAMRKEV